MPIDPGPSRWDLPDPATAGAAGVDVVARGGELDAPTALAGYRNGLFAMAHRRKLIWYSPDPRGILPVEAFHASRSLRRSCRTFEVSVDHAFEAVVDGCADPRPGSGTWIDGAYRALYTDLFALGWAHSVEVWHGGGLAGGLIGVELGGLFCGESMFHRATDASKAAVWATCVLLRSGPGQRLFDVQWLTDHLASLGATQVRRSQYLNQLPAVLAGEPALRPTPRQGLLELVAGTAGARPTA